MAEEVGRDDVAPERRFGELREVPPVARHAMQAHDPVGAGLAHSSSATSPLARPRPGGSGCHLRPLVRSFTSDQMTVPTLSMRNVPRCARRSAR